MELVGVIKNWLVAGSNGLLVGVGVGQITSNAPLAVGCGLGILWLLYYLGTLAWERGES